jgi:hypothetical protein
LAGLSSETVFADNAAGEAPGSPEKAAAFRSNLHSIGIASQTQYNIKQISKFHFKNPPVCRTPGKYSWRKRPVERDIQGNHSVKQRAVNDG